MPVDCNLKRCCINKKDAIDVHDNIFHVSKSWWFRHELKRVLLAAIIPKSPGKWKYCIKELRLRLGRISAGGCELVSFDMQKGNNMAYDKLVTTVSRPVVATLRLFLICDEQEWGMETKDSFDINVCHLCSDEWCSILIEEKHKSSTSKELWSSLYPQRLGTACFLLPPAWSGV